MSSYEEYPFRRLVLGPILTRNANKYPDRPAIVDLFRNKRFTYKEFNDRVNSLANGLLDLGVRPGDHVAIMFFNEHRILESYFAVWKIGAVAAPLNFRYGPNDLRYVLPHSDSVALIFSGDVLPVVNEVKKDVKNVKHYICAIDNPPQGMHSYEELIRKYPNTEIPGKYWPHDDDPCLLLYTAGTTGRPKGVIHTHKDRYIAVCDYNIHVGSRPFGVTGVITPIFHCSALTGLLATIYVAGKCVIMMPGPPEQFLEALDKEKIEATFQIPVMWIWTIRSPKFGEYDVSSLKHLVTGAQPTPLTVKKELMEKFPNAMFHDQFGQTEALPPATDLHSEFCDIYGKADSLGVPLFCVEVRVVDENGNDVPPGEIGEAVYRSPHIMTEYYKDPEKTKAAFEGGWFHSGDMVRKDKDGYIYFVERKDDMIITGGEHVYPTEIEEVLYTHPKVMEAAVIGVPSEKWGQTPKAFIVLKKGEKATEKEILDYCKDKLAGYKKPTMVEFVESIPKSVVGKTLRKVLRDMEREKYEKSKK
ncbi:MAG: AMP-binding protein [Candidatus Freyarchaeota archaeon]